MTPDCIEAPEDLGVGGRLYAHERLCAERYAEVLRRLSRLERVVLWAAGGLILGQMSIIGFLLVRVLHL
jgi:hypothetical protein